MRRLGREPALDGVRALAVLGVMYVHAVAFLAPEHVHRLGRGGFFGVDVFFVLSGFLINTLLLQELDEHGRIGFLRFYGRRALRLIPALALMLTLWSAYNFHEHDVSVEKLVLDDLAALFYVQNWVEAAGHLPYPGLGHLWSLSVEEQFYLVWPAAAVLLSRLRPRRAAMVLTATILAVGIWRWVVWSHSGSSVFGQWFVPYIRTDTRMDALLIGALAAIAWRHGWLTVGRRLTVVAALGLLCCVLLVGIGDAWLFTAGGFTAVDLMAAVLVVGLVDRGDGLRFFAHPLLVYLGGISYALYLWHVPVDQFLSDQLVAPTWQRLVASLALSVGLAALSMAVLERPLSKLKPRLAPVHPDPGSTSGSADSAPRAGRSRRTGR